MGFRVQGLGVRHEVTDMLRFRVWGLGFRVWGLGVRQEVTDMLRFESSK